MITSVETPSSCCRFGIARCDITPPVGIYHRMWGAATHDRATGVHKPLFATAMTIARAEDASDRFVLVALDHCLLWQPEMNELRNRILADRPGRRPERLLITFSHTHGAGLMDRTRGNLPGGELIAPYFDWMCNQVVSAVDQAQCAKPATISYSMGRCDLARHRDAWDEASQQWVCGWNPEGPSDDTVLAARITNAAGEVIGTIVNYACHPTTLAWQNTLISPDYIGALREIIEKTTGAPCIFLQGATGDLGPRDGYVGDTEIADRNGRQLAYAALSALESLPPPQATSHYIGPVVSGATLGTWEHRPWSDERRDHACGFAIQRTIVPLPYRPDRPKLDDLQRDREHWLHVESVAQSAGDAAHAREARAMVERATRAITRWQHCPPGDTFPYELTLLRLGDAIWVFGEGELYQLFQTELRRRFPDRTLLIGMLADGWRPAYLPTRETYGRGVYQEQVALLAPGCLEALIDAAADEIRAL